MAILAVADHENSKIDEATLRTLGAAALIAMFNVTDVHVLVVGSQVKSAAEAAAQIAGVTNVFFTEALERYTCQRTQPDSEFITLASTYSHILASATPAGTELAGRIARKMKVSLVSNVSAICSAEAFERKLDFGDDVDTVRSFGTVNIVTILDSKFNPVWAGGGMQLSRRSAIRQFIGARFFWNGCRRCP